jgi:hypothetical protein
MKRASGPFWGNNLKISASKWILVIEKHERAKTRQQAINTAIGFVVVTEDTHCKCVRIKAFEEETIFLDIFLIMNWFVESTVRFKCRSFDESPLKIDSYDQFCFDCADAAYSLSASVASFTK